MSGETLGSLTLSDVIITSVLVHAVADRVASNIERSYGRKKILVNRYEVNIQNETRKDRRGCYQ